MKYSYDIRKIRNGDQMEFRRLIDNNMNRIYAIALRITADAEDAGDIVQDSLIKIWEKRKALKNSAGIEAYIRKVVINKSYDLLRKKKRQAGNETDFELVESLLTDDSADRNLDNKELASIISTLSNGLSPKQKLVFTLVELEQMSHDEVSAETGMSKSSIKSNLSHARSKVENGLRKYLKD